MHIPPAHALVEREAVFALMAAHPLGAWVCPGRDGLVANHLPFHLDQSRGPHGTLVAHVARANPVWRELPEQAPSVVIFQGPQAYITPGWYPGKAAHGRVVPTWNYLVAHAHGVAHAFVDRHRLLALLHQLTDTQEAAQPHPWRVSDAPADYIDAMLSAIVGIEMPIDRIEARLKASQDEDLADRLGTVRGLRSSPVEGAAAMADWVEQALASQQAPG